jgi:hypothetical protein
MKKLNKNTEYIRYSHYAIDAFCLCKRLSQAASISKEVGEALEEAFDYEGASSMYAKAAELYVLDNLPT